MLTTCRKMLLLGVIGLIAATTFGAQAAGALSIGYQAGSTYWS